MLNAFKAVAEKKKKLAQKIIFIVKLSNNRMIWPSDMNRVRELGAAGTDFKSVI